MVNFTILAGGYDLFIASYIFNSDASTLSLAGTYPTGSNPSWLSVHPTNQSIIYATNEIEEGAVQSFIADRSGALSAPISTVSSGGGSPAHVVGLSSGQVAVTNYMGGNGRIIPTFEDPLQFDDAAAGVISFPPPASEGGVSHPHFTYEYGDEVLIPDLGADTVWRLIEDGSPGNWKIAGSIDQPKGSGPRHVAVIDNLLYTLHELDSTLSVQAIPDLGTTDTSEPLASISIIPSDAPEGSAYGAAELLIPEPNTLFPTRYLYASNRNIGDVTEERGDSIAIFEYTGTELRLINQFFTGLDQIRGVKFGGENNEYLVASGVVGDGGVAVFERTEEGKSFVELARNTEVLTRISFVWL